MNIQGCIPSTRNNKLQHLKEWMQTSPYPIPFVVLTETHFEESVKDPAITIPGYSITRVDRSGRRQGGVVIYCSLPISDSSYFSSGFCEAAMIHIVPANVVVIGVYRPPVSYSHKDRNCPPEHFKNCLNKVEEFIGRFHSPTVLMLGDFNLPFINWNDHSLGTGGRVSAADRSSAGTLIQLVENHFLQQFVSEPTRNQNILDLILCNNEDLIHSTETTKSVLSDHHMVSTLLRTNEFLIFTSLMDPANTLNFPKPRNSFLSID